MTVEQLLEAANKRIDELQTDIRNTPRPGAVLRPFESVDPETGEIVPWLYPGRQRDSRRIGAARRIKDPEWALVVADWRAVAEPVEPVKGEAAA